MSKITYYLGAIGVETIDAAWHAAEAVVGTRILTANAYPEYDYSGESAINSVVGYFCLWWPFALIFYAFVFRYCNENYRTRNQAGHFISHFISSVTSGAAGSAILHSNIKPGKNAAANAIGAVLVGLVAVLLKECLFSRIDDCTSEENQADNNSLHNILRQHGVASRPAHRNNSLADIPENPLETEAVRDAYQPMT